MKRVFWISSAVGRAPRSTAHKMRAKPAVPLAGKYRLIDISDQQLHSILVSTDLCADPVQQFASLKPDLQTYHSRRFRPGFWSRCSAARRRPIAPVVRGNG